MSTCQTRELCWYSGVMGDCCVLSIYPSTYLLFGFNLNSAETNPSWLCTSWTGHRHTHTHIQLQASYSPLVFGLREKTHSHKSDNMQTLQRKSRQNHNSACLYLKRCSRERNLSERKKVEERTSRGYQPQREERCIFQGLCYQNTLKNQNKWNAILLQQLLWSCSSTYCNHICQFFQASHYLIAINERFKTYDCDQFCDMILLMHSQNSHIFIWL